MIVSHIELIIIPHNRMVNIPNSTNLDFCYLNLPIILKGGLFEVYRLQVRPITLCFVLHHLYYMRVDIH